MMMMKRLIILMAVISVALLFGCGRKAEEKKTGQEKKLRLEVVTTTGMIADIVKNVGGDLVNVEALMGPETDPHLYKAGKDDIKKMSDADIVFHNGFHLEAAMDRLLTNMKGKAFPVTERMDPSFLLKSGESEDSYDPHVWFNVRLWMSAVEYVRDKLIEYDRGSAVIFGTNADNYMTDLAELHDYVYKLARTVPKQQRVLITAHDAFRYFGEAYGFQVLGLKGISTASEVGDKKIEEIVKTIGNHRLAAVFVERSVPSETMETLLGAVTATGHDIKIGGELCSGAMGREGTTDRTYVGMIRHNIATIVNALMGGKEPVHP